MNEGHAVVACIDPGIAHTGIGIVRFDGKTPTILVATTINTSPQSKGNNARQRARDTWGRVLHITNEAASLVCSYHPDLIGIELFSDQGAVRKQYSGRGDTAMLIGALVSRLEADHVLCPLDSTVVASSAGAMREQVEWWKEGRASGLAGEELVLAKASVHAREAVAHALFLGRSHMMLGLEGVYAL